MKKLLITFGIIILVLIVWGIIGSSEVERVGNTCDFGINNSGSVFCWKWHQNIVGDIQEGIDEIFNK